MNIEEKRKILELLDDAASQCREAHDIIEETLETQLRRLNDSLGKIEEYRDTLEDEVLTHEIKAHEDEPELDTF